MATEMISQKIKKTCDACGKQVEYELWNATDETMAALTTWYTVVREVVLLTQQGPQFSKKLALACSLECVPITALKLAMPSTGVPGDEDKPEVDLASLQQNNSDPTVN